MRARPADLLNQSVFVPSQPEQERIAEILDTIDLQISATERQIDKLILIRQGLVEGSIERSGVHSPGAKSQPLITFVEHLIDFRGRTPKKLGLDWGGGEILALSANNVQMGRIDTTREAYFGGEVLYSAWMTHGPTRRGDVLITLEAPLGNIAQIPDDSRYILSQRVVLLRFNEAVMLNDFAFWLLQRDSFQRELVRKSTGTTASGIRRAELERILLPVLPIPEQRNLANGFRAAQRVIDTETELLVKLRRLRRGVMADLLTGEVRVPCEAAT